MGSTQAGAWSGITQFTDEEMDRVEVKIGVLHTPREIVVESPLSREEVIDAVNTALSSVDGSLQLTDDRRRLVIVPANLVAYVEVGLGDARPVGFGSASTVPAPPDIEPR